MRQAVFNAMLVTLLRDRAAFALTFLLPPLVFAVFAAIFSAAARGDLEVSVAYIGHDGARTATLVERLESSPSVTSLQRLEDKAALTALVRRGKVDVGLEVLPAQSGVPLRFRLYLEQSRIGAAALMEAALVTAQTPRATTGGDMFQRVIVAGDAAAPPMAAYYAAGVIMLFLFLSGLQGALSLIEERDSGILERVMAGPFGIRALIGGKFLFLVVQGVAQATVVLVVAALFFDVAIFERPLELVVGIVVAALCAAGLSLAMVASCRSRGQAHALGTALVLIMAALGGSMAPRFLMAPEVRALGDLMPNAWGIDAISAALWRGGGLDLVAWPFALLLVSGLVGVAIAHFAARRSLCENA